jgi:hypothetical protein
MTESYLRGFSYFDQQKFLIRRRTRQTARRVLLWLFSLIVAFGLGLVLAFA